MKKFLVICGNGRLGTDDTMIETSVHIVDEKKLETFAKDGSIRENETRIFEFGKELKVIVESTLKIKNGKLELVNCEYPY